MTQKTDTATVIVPTPLQEHTDGQAELTVRAGSVREVLDALSEQYPSIEERLRKDNGDLEDFMNIYVNDEDIRFQDDLDTPVEPGDELSIIPAIAGGR